MVHSNSDTEFVIRDKVDLHRLLASRGYGQTSVFRRFRFDLKDTNRSRQITWERRVNRLYSRCGCVTGSLLTLSTLVVGALHLIRKSDSLSFTDWLLLIPAAIVASVLIGLAGKIVAQRFNNFQLKRVISHIYEHV